MRIRELKGLGPASEAMLKTIGINSVEVFMKTSPFELYKRLYENGQAKNLNFLYAMIGAQENTHWQEITRTRRTEILLMLDDLGLAPK
jgi:DNA transformation protein